MPPVWSCSPYWASPQCSLNAHPDFSAFCPSLWRQLQSDLIYWHATSPSKPQSAPVQSHPPLRLSQNSRTFCTWEIPNQQWQQQASGHFSPPPYHGGFWAGAGAEHFLVTPKSGFQALITHSHFTSSCLLITSHLQWHEFQLLMAPITTAIIICIEIKLCFSSIFMHMTWKLIFHWHFFIK